jgi:hypothetical protein
MDMLIALERAWGFPAKGLLAAPGKDEGRPAEIATFMKYGRKWEGRQELETKTVGPREMEGSFAHGWWRWWRSLQPQKRKESEDGVLTCVNNLSAEEWEMVAKTHGRNGMLLVVGCLLWWGDAAAATQDTPLQLEWKKAVEDVTWVLGKTLESVGALYIKTCDGGDSAVLTLPSVTA